MPLLFSFHLFSPFFPSAHLREMNYIVVLQLTGSRERIESIGCLEMMVSRRGYDNVRSSKKKCHFYALVSSFELVDYEKDQNTSILIHFSSSITSCITYLMRHKIRNIAFKIFFSDEDVKDFPDTTQIETHCLRLWIESRFWRWKNYELYIRILDLRYHLIFSKFQDQLRHSPEGKWLHLVQIYSVQFRRHEPGGCYNDRKDKMPTRYNGSYKYSCIYGTRIFWWVEKTHQIYVILLYEKR